jgi:hypothetical protein
MKVLIKTCFFSVWDFDKKPPKFISHAKPQHEQFDTSTQISSVSLMGQKNARESGYQAKLKYYT